MTNENELQEMREQLQLQSDVCNLLKSRKERIDALESAIREFVAYDVAMDLACIEDTPDYDLCEKWSASRANFRNILENKS